MKRLALIFLFILIASSVLAFTVTTVPNTRMINGHPLSSDITLNSDDVGAVPIGTPFLTAPSGTGIIVDYNGISGLFSLGTASYCFAMNSIGTGFMWTSCGGGASTSFAYQLPLSFATPTVSMTQSGSSSNGWLSSGDWTIFNGKESASQVSSAISSSQATWGYQTAGNVSSSISLSIIALNLPTTYAPITGSSTYQTASQVSSAISSSAIAGNWQSGSQVVTAITNSISALNLGTTYAPITGSATYQTAAQVASAISTSNSGWGYQTASNVSSAISSSLSASIYPNYLWKNGNGSSLTNLAYSQLTGTPTWNQATTGNAGGLSASANVSTSGTITANAFWGSGANLSSMTYSELTGTPNWQTAANVSSAISSSAAAANWQTAAQVASAISSSLSASIYPNYWLKTATVNTAGYANSSGTTTAFASNPTGTCTGGQFATGILATGSPVCGTPSGSGTVTSVGLALPSDLTLSGTNPIISAGTFTITRSSESQSYFLAAPSSGAGTPVYRAIVAGDVSSLGYQTAANVSSAISSSATTSNWQSASQVSTAISSSLAAGPYQTAANVGSDISSSLGAWAGSTNITTIGTIATGTVPYAHTTGVAPAFGSLSNGDWCNTNGTTVSCAQSAPINMVWPSVAGIPYWSSGTSWQGAYSATNTIPATYISALNYAPAFGTLTNGDWCTTDGSTVTCTQPPPSGSGTVTNVTITTTSPLTVSGSNPTSTPTYTLGINTSGAWSGTSSGLLGGMTTTLFTNGSVVMGPYNYLTLGALSTAWSYTFYPGAYISFSFGQLTTQLWAGLTSTIGSAETDSIDYAFVTNSGSNGWFISENNVYTGVSGAAYAVTDTFLITYDGSNVRYYYNGTLERTVTSVTKSLSAYFYDALGSNNIINNIAMGSYAANNSLAYGLLNSTGTWTLGTLVTTVSVSTPDIYTSQTITGNAIVSLTSVSATQIYTGGTETNGNMYSAGTITGGILVSTTSGSIAQLYTKGTTTTGQFYTAGTATTGILVSTGSITTSGALTAASYSGILTGVTASVLNGTIASAGTCSTATVSVTGSALGMPVYLSPTDGVFTACAALKSGVTAAGTVTVYECAITASCAITNQKFNVRVFK